MRDGVEERCIWGEDRSKGMLDRIQEKMLAWVTTADEKSARRKPKDSYAMLINVGLDGA